MDSDPGEGTSDGRVKNKWEAADIDITKEPDIEDESFEVNSNEKIPRNHIAKM